METNIYTFTANNIKGSAVNLACYQGKVILVVNTASKCGFTPQFRGLENLYQKYKNKNFVILGFPCNQFGNQEPGDEASIEQGCLLNYGVTFPMFEKINVNGADAHPLFNYLKVQLPGTFGQSIKWNFTKFLIDSHGQPIKRFSPFSTPENIDRHIASLFQ